MKSLKRKSDLSHAGSRSFSQRTIGQASALEEIASTIEKTAATMTQNSENAANADNVSIASSHFAEEGGELVRESIEKISKGTEYKSPWY